MNYLPRLPEIILYQGGTSTISVDLTEFGLQGGTVVLTIRDSEGAELYTHDFTAEAETALVFEPEFTKTLRPTGTYSYDFMWVLDGERFPQCAPSPVVVRRTVGGLRGD